MSSNLSLPNQLANALPGEELEKLLIKIGERGGDWATSVQRAQAALDELNSAAGDLYALFEQSCREALERAIQAQPAKGLAGAGQAQRGGPRPISNNFRKG